jgi:hypothetical protein
VRSDNDERQRWKKEECNGLDEGGLRQRWKKEECDKACGSILCPQLIGWMEMAQSHHDFGAIKSPKPSLFEPYYD